MSPITEIRKNIFAMTQAEFAAEVGVAQSTVSRWDKGALEPSRSDMLAIRRLARRGQVDWSDSWFFDGPEGAST